jgi:fructose-1,6-bisphosphatase
MERRKLVRDTDIGKKLIDQIDDLKQLLVAFRKGQIR